MTEKTEHTERTGPSEYDRGRAGEDAEAIERIQRECERLDNAHFAFSANWAMWQGGNDISREDLAADLRAVERSAVLMRSAIATLQERKASE